MFEHVRYKFIVMMASWGAIVGTAEVMGFFPEHLYWIYLFSWLITAIAGVRALSAGWFVNGTLIGFSIPLVAAGMKLLLFETYTENNGTYIRTLELRLGGSGVKSFLFSLALITSVGNGIIQGLICIAAVKLFKKKQSHSA